jgi:hypothetical protein
MAILCLTLPIVELTNAQTITPTLEWSQTYGPYQGYAIVPTNDGGYAIACQNATHDAHGYNRYRPMIIKTDSNGNIQWQTEVPNIGGYAISIVQTTDLGYAIGCQPNGTVIKIDEQGNIQWEKALGSARCYVLQATDGNYVIAGDRQNTGTGGYDAFLLKINQNGGQLWSKTFQFGFITGVTTFVETPDGGYAFAGQTSGYFAKTDSNGNLIWNQTYLAPSTGNSLDFSCVANDVNGGFVLAGFETNGLGGYLLKTDSQGNIQSTYQYQNSSIQSIVKTPNGYVAAGVINHQYGLFEINYVGEILWVVNIPANPFCISLTHDKGYIVTGALQESTIWVGKFTPPLTNPTLTPNPSVTIKPNNSHLDNQQLISIALVAILAIIVVLAWIFRRHRKTANLKQ